ncbi:hypothetical protein HK097_000780 [Rhizophlyctis rosea]|uniref:CCDC66 domain-containing protein n=1 Tax=Rhizophlyctis rosea TaxID=64517 RepID=A0AAD5SHN2_9FUNG|nr:hypothetical protein HK097_000780 [Rhizophlyctis rosea]
MPINQQYNDDGGQQRSNNGLAEQRGGASVLERQRKVQQYAKELELQIAEKRATADEERRFRQDPGFSEASDGNQMRTHSPRRQPPGGVDSLGHTSAPIGHLPPVSSISGQKRGAARGFSSTAVQRLRWRTPLSDTQVREKREKQAREKAMFQMEDQKKEQEMAQYNPWGRAGAGAPTRNANGMVTGRRGQPQATAQRLPAINPRSENSYRTPDFFANDKFMETVRGLTSEQRTYPSETKPNVNTDMGMDAHVVAGPSSNQQSFTRGRECMNPWERDEHVRKQKLQREHQEGLQRQIAEREAERSKQSERKRKEDEAEQARLLREQELLKERYAKELEHAKRKETQDLQQTSLKFHPRQCFKVLGKTS